MEDDRFACRRVGDLNSPLQFNGTQICKFGSV